MRVRRAGSRRVVSRRRLRQSREQRRLCERELLRRLREVRLRRGLDTVGLAAVVDLVQVRRQDLLLRPLVGELHGEARFAQLPRERALSRDVEVAHELLRDRRAALHDLALADVGPEGAGDADGVDPAVLPVALVLDRNRRLADPRADLVRRDFLPVPSFGRDGAEAGAVRGVDERVLAERERLQRRERAALLVRDRAAEADREEHAGEHDAHRACEDAHAPAPGAALAPLRPQPPRAKHLEREVVAPPRTAAWRAHP